MTTARSEQRADKKAHPALRRPAAALPKPKPSRKTYPNAKGAPSRNKTAAARKQNGPNPRTTQATKGATLKEITKATSWQPHSVRGFLSGTLRKKLGLRVDSIKRDDAERTYRIASK